MTQRCIDCGQMKARLRVGASRVYRDGGGNAWTGVTCGSRTDAASGVGSNDALYPPKMRACRHCGDSTSNYYNCVACTDSSAGVGCLDTIEPHLGTTRNYRAGENF